MAAVSETTQYIVGSVFVDTNTDQTCVVVAAWTAIVRGDNWVAFEYEDGAVRVMYTREALPQYRFLGPGVR